MIKMDENQNQNNVQITDINKTESQENAVNEQNIDAVLQSQEPPKTNDAINEQRPWYKSFISGILSFFKRSKQ